MHCLRISLKLHAWMLCLLARCVETQEYLGPWPQFITLELSFEVLALTRRRAPSALPLLDDDGDDDDDDDDDD